LRKGEWKLLLDDNDEEFALREEGDPVVETKAEMTELRLLLGVLLNGAESGKLPPHFFKVCPCLSKFVNRHHFNVVVACGHTGQGRRVDDVCLEDASRGEPVLIAVGKVHGDGRH